MPRTKKTTEAAAPAKETAAKTAAKKDETAEMAAAAKTAAKAAKAAKTTKATAAKTSETAEKAEAAEKKTPAKKAPAKKAAPKKVAPKKPAAKAEAVETKVNFFVEFGGVQVAVEDVINNIKATNGKDAKEISVYLKPEESKAYFVADGEEKEMDVFFC